LFVGLLVIRFILRSFMKIFKIVLLTIVFNLLVTYGLLYFLVLSKNIVIEAGTEKNQDLNLPEGTITLEKGASLKGNISLDSGKVLLNENSRIEGGIQLGQGSLKMERNTKIKGDIKVKEGEIFLAEGASVEGNIDLQTGNMQKHSSAKISGRKPDIYVTYNWPEALAFFDVLPEEHKQAVGYIFLTKENNILVREDDIKTQDYFDGIYVYKDHDLHPMDLQNEEAMEKFFNRAKDFFKGLPERRLGAFGVGATTKNFAFNQAKADIYIPSSGSRYTFIHEMGHVMDFKYNFIDDHRPLYPFLSQELAVSGYGATHPGEDFAEAYKYYVLSHDYFSELIEEHPERQQKYDFLKKHVFQGKEFRTPGERVT
jgi:hypothetical protein